MFICHYVHNGNNVHNVLYVHNVHSVYNVHDVYIFLIMFIMFIYCALSDSSGLRAFQTDVTHRWYYETLNHPPH